MARRMFSVLSFLTLVSAAAFAQTALPPEMKTVAEKAKAGDANAQYEVGARLQAMGKPDEARPWYEKASAQDHPLATSLLGYLYETGMGIDKDIDKALSYYKKGVELGAPESMWQMAMLHGEGKLGKADPMQRCVWILRTNKHVTMDHQMLMGFSGREIAKMQKSMPAKEFASCKEKAEAWTPGKLAAKDSKETKKEVK